jgi:HAE1 family hydrophobic/amphiphilic exporter-1
MGIMIVLLVGMLAYNSLELAYMPSTESPMAVVSTTYSGAGPEEIEDLITKPIEETVATLTGVDTISSTSSTGSSMVMIEFVDGTDIDVATQDLRDKIDQVKGRLPDDASDPTIMKMDMNQESIAIGVTSTKYDTNDLYTFCDENITQEFEKIQDISSVSIMGGANDVVEITVDQDKMENYGITINSLRQSLSVENSNTPAGNVYQGSTSLQLRAVGEFESLNDIKDLVIKTSGGNVVHVSDVADVQMVTEEKESLFLINGNPGIRYSLDKQSDANIVTVSDNINATIDQLEKDYPELDFVLLTSTSDYIKTSINNVVKTAFEAALIAFFVLLFFLRDFRTAFIICVSIPTSIMATFAMMYIKGMTLNTISMGGLVIGIGMLVDNSTVVLDNISKCHDRGMSPKEAAYVGAKEVSLAIMASTLTNIAVFAPLIFVTGMMGQMLQDLAYTICFALAASIVTALTAVPMAAALLMRRNDKKKNKKKTIFTYIGDFMLALLNTIDRGYKWLLRRALKYKLITIVITIVCFVSTLSTGTDLGMSLMSSSDESAASISVEMPDGIEYAKKEEKLYEIMDAMGDIPEADTIYANVGGGGMGGRGGSISININLVDQEYRDRSTDDIVADLKSKFADIAGCKITVSASSNAMGSFGGASNLSLKITGSETDELKQISDDLCEVLENMDGASNVSSSLDDAVPEGNIVLNRAKAAKYGITTSDLASTINTAVSGTTATEYKVNGTEVDVTIKYPDDSVKYLKDLNNLTIKTSTGVSIPLTEVADIEMGESATSISREDQQRYITLSASFDGMDSSAVQKLVEAELQNYVFPEGYSYEFGGSMQMMQDTFTSLAYVLVVGILLIYMILASQFESFIEPVILMAAMPISLTGGLFGLFITGQSITSTAIMGFIMLVGMVVNNAIVLIDVTKQIRARTGATADEALLEAGPTRLRAILMTTLTTIISLMPMAFGGGSGMESQQPLAVVVIFGMALSTLVTLVFVPVTYSLIDKFTNFCKRIIFRNSDNESDVDEPALES